MNNGIRFHAAREAFFGEIITICMWQPANEGKDDAYIADPIVFRKRMQGDHTVPPATMALSRDAAQRLMDELWHVGLRPSEGSGSAGSLAATERHLADMRAIVFTTPPKP